MKKAIIIISIVVASLVVIAAGMVGFMYLNDFHIEMQMKGKKDITLEYGDKYVEEGAVAHLKGKFLLKDGRPVDVVTEGKVNAEKLGEYTVKYTAILNKMNAELKRTVRIVDTVAPVLTLNGKTEITLTRGDKFTDAGFTATDNYDGDISSNVIVSGAVDTTKVGEYTLTYDVKDGSGNSASATRKITVKAPPEPPKPVLPTTVYPGSKTVYLTFDDGPGPHTARLLDVLQKYNAKATFFVIKTGYSDLISRMAAEGHAVGLHTATHNYKKIYSSEQAFFDDLEAIQQVVVAKTGQRTNLIRFPGGSSNRVSSFNPGIMTRLTAAVTQKGYRYFDWNVDSNDAGGAKTSAEVITKVTAGIAKRDVSVVLQHDIKNFSVDAVETILKWGVENGYTFKALDETSPVCQHTVNN